MELTKLAEANELLKKKHELEKHLEQLDLYEGEEISDLCLVPVNTPPAPELILMGKFLSGGSRGHMLKEYKTKIQLQIIRLELEIKAL